MVKKIKLEEQNIENNINITSLNTQAMKKTFRKKVSLTKKLIIAGLIASTAIGGIYGYQQYQNAQQEKEEKEQQIFNEIDKIINEEPQTTELIELKEKYGDLYYLVEPMTEEQINEQIIIIRNYQIIAGEKLEKNKFKYDEFGFYYENEDQYFEVTGKQLLKGYEAFSPIFESNDPALARWHDYYGPMGDFRTMLILPYLTVENGIEQMPVELKEAYIRYWKASYHIMESVREDYGLPTTPFYGDNLTSSVDFDKQIVYIKR